MDEIAQIEQIRKQKTIQSPHRQATMRQACHTTEEKPSKVKQERKPHKEPTGCICTACGEQIMNMVIPQLGITYPLPCACGRKKIHEDEAKRKASEGRLHVHILTEQAQLPIEAQRWTFDDFIPRPGTEDALNTAKQYTDRFQSARKNGAGLVIYGCTGSGKSHIAAAIANTVIQKQYSVRWWTVPELYAEIQATYHSGTSDADILHECKNVSLLVLDDLGAEKPSDWTRQTFNMIINSRVANGRPTVITTNKDFKMLSAKDKKGEKALDDRTLSRLRDKDHFVWLFDRATDYREVRR